MKDSTNRREFLKQAAVVTAGIAVTGSCRAVVAGEPDRPPYRISLAQWSLNKLFKAKGGDLDNLEFAEIARKEFALDAIEYSSQMFQDKAADRKYLREMKKRQQDAGVKALLIMVDHEGQLGDPDATARKQAVENHYKWAEAAKFLGCHSVRVNAASAGSWDEQLKYAADGLRRLTEFGAKLGLNTIVENHGGLSSNGKWLAAVIKKADHPRSGTLPDFGNFVIDRKTGEEYDRYQGVRELMPFAKAVSAKSNEFDKDGNEVHTDYRKMMQIVVDAGYHGCAGIEFGGDKHSKFEGVRLTKALLERVRKEIADGRRE